MVPTMTQPRNPKAFYAILDDQAGALTKVHGILYFIADEGTITEITPAHVNFLVTLGAMELADAQRLDDLVRGGTAAIACTRQMEAA